MQISELIPTQDGFRLSIDEINSMAAFVREGGIYTFSALKKYNPYSVYLIAVTEFEDGRRYIRDGIHRVASIYMGGRKELDDQEYFIERLTYDRYMVPRVQVRWFTPFDPRTHVRVPNFAAFKNKVDNLLEWGIDPIRFISSYSHMYCLPRQDYHNSIMALSSRYLEGKHG